MTDFAEDYPKAVTVWDSHVKGLLIRIGRHRATWTFYQEHRFRGKRRYAWRRLGFYPAMNVKAARKAALVMAGKHAAGHIEPSANEATRFGAAVDSYIAHLRDESAKKEKTATWAQAIEWMKAKHFGRFEQWTLKELSDNPEPVEQWHKEITRKSGPVAGNKAALVMRAVYRHSAKRDRTLPVALPTSAIEFNKEAPRETGVNDFAAWGDAWRKIEHPTRRALTHCFACFLESAQARAHACVGRMCGRNRGPSSSANRKPEKIFRCRCLRPSPVV